MSDVAVSIDLFQALDDIRNLPGERVPLRDLSSMPSDMVTMASARRDLDTRQFGAWSLLRMHLFEFGCLPTGVRALAKICGVGASSFERMAPALARHFDRDGDKRWIDRDLLRARGNRLVIEATPTLPRQKNPNRQRGGLRNAILHWHPDWFDAAGEIKPEHREAFDARLATLVSDGKVEGNDGIETGREGESVEVTVSDAPSLLASSDSKHFQKQASELAARADEPVTIPAAPVGDGNALAHPPAGGGNGADGKPTEVMPPAPGPSDVAMVDAIVRVCRGKVDKAHACMGLPVFRRAMAEGLDFFKDVVPTLEQFASRNASVQNCANKHVLADARKRRDARLIADGLGGADANTPPRRIYKGTPEGDAYLARMPGGKFPIQDGERWYRIDYPAAAATSPLG